MSCLVSIIMPVYNDSDYLSAAVTSVLNQSLREWELLCVDDASSDSSLALLEDYAQRDSRIKVIALSENHSALVARKRAVEQAKGRYIMFLDADDSLAPEALAELVEQMELRQVEALQFGAFLDNVDEVEPATRQWLTEFLAPYTSTLRDKTAIIRSFVERRLNWLLWNKIFRAEVCQRAFRNIKDTHKLYRYNDMFIFFLLAMQLESLEGIEKQYYHYNFGRGYGNAKDFRLERFIKECPGAVELLSSSKSYLQELGLEKEYGHAVDMMKSVLVDFYAWKLNDLKEQKEWEQAAALLIKSFGWAAVGKHLYALKAHNMYLEQQDAIKGEELQGKSRELLCKNSELESKNKELEVVVQQLEGKSSELEVVGQQLEAKNQELIERNSAFASLQEEYKQAEKELQEQEQVSQSLSEKLEQSEQELENTQTILEKTEQELENTLGELQLLKKNYADIKSGYSFRIGRVITYLPRKLTNRD